MATVQITANITLENEQLLEAFSQMDLADLEQVYNSLGKILKQRKSEDLNPSPFYAAAESPAESPAESAAEETNNNIPIVEKFIPASITLDGSSFSL